ncbi:MAG: class I SAM-dependent methyltransferase [Paracoccaceae bacterium]
MVCPVCEAAPLTAFLSVAAQRYHRCPACLATVLDPACRLPPAQEKAHYDHHENDPDDPRYRAFLNRLCAPLLARLPPASRGLDYGCGPGPALAAMLREAGHDVAIYDPFYAPDPAPLAGVYDFVTCTEVAEHFFHPAAEFARMMAMLRPGGWLAVMTCFQTDDARFAAWHYRKDPTHVVFYRAETLAHIARAHGWACTIPAKDVAILQRPL